MAVIETVGVGFTVTVKVLDGPAQLFTVATTVIVATIGTAVMFAAV